MYRARQVLRRVPRYLCLLFVIFPQQPSPEQERIRGSTFRRFIQRTVVFFSSSWCLCIVYDDQHQLYRDLSQLLASISSNISSATRLGFYLLVFSQYGHSIQHSR